MIDAKTWIDVADSAVKIGLGALLGGGFAIWKAHLSDSSEAKRSFLKKKREMIEKVLEEIDAFFASATVYWARLADAVFKRKEDKQLTSEEAHELKNLEQQLFDNFKNLGFSSSRLVLIGEDEVEKTLREFSDTVEEFFKIGTIDDPNCTEEILQSHKKSIQASRQKLFYALRIAYRRPE